MRVTASEFKTIKAAVSVLRRRYCDLTETEKGTLSDTFSAIEAIEKRLKEVNKKQAAVKAEKKKAGKA